MGGFDDEENLVAEGEKDEEISEEEKGVRLFVER